MCSNKGMKTGSIGRGWRAAGKVTLKLEAQHGRENRNGGEKEKTSSNRRVSFREERSWWVKERRGWADVTDYFEALWREQTESFMLFDTLKKWLQNFPGKLLTGRENLENWQQLGKKGIQPEELPVVETTVKQGWNWWFLLWLARWQMLCFLKCLLCN